MSKAPVFLQARMSSSRLPGKVLLPVAGYPLVVLAALRAGNREHKVTVLTSTDPSDDPLAETLRAHEIAVRRGSLDDVLSRFAGAASLLKPDQPVFRLTADNLVPDGALLGEMEATFAVKTLDYLTSTGPESGLPYGISAEMVRAGDLLAAARDPETTSFEREHVTPQIIRKHGRTVFQGSDDPAAESFRLTVDTLEDYLRICRVFDGIDDPIGADFRFVSEVAIQMEREPQSVRKPAFILGGVQLGMAYGIANRTGRPSAETAHWIIGQAVDNGAAWIDTAQAYGDSEQVIGDALKVERAAPGVITKLRPVAAQTNHPKIALLEEIERSIDRSCRLLGRAPAILFHRYADSLLWDRAVLRLLEKRKSKGDIEAVGASVQSPAEFTASLSEPRLSIIQMPFNLLDWRWDGALAELERARRERPIIVHVRSAFLQGLLLSRDPAHWARAHCADPSGGAWLDQLAADFGRRDRVDLCLAFVRAHDFIDGIVLGCETPAQLAANLAAFERPVLSSAQMDDVRRTRPMVSEKVLDPSKWS